MEFIDNTGHIFSLQSYDTDLGWEYTDTEYIFWINGCTGTEIPVSSYNILQIVPYIGTGNTIGVNGTNILLDNIKSINITCYSNIFKLKGYNSNNFNSDVLEFDMTTDDVMSKATSIIYNKKDLIKSDTELLAPFFVVCRSDSEGTFMTNILIEIIYTTEDNKEMSVYTVIRTGGVFTDESEKLKINANNFGIELPKNILSAVYESNIVDSTENFDVSLYNEKLKEYLMNRISISGEIGNYNSMRNALAWFGWSEKLEMYKLLKTDNKLVEQYVRDSFDIKDDILNSFKRFRNVSLLSFKLKENDILYKEINNSNDKCVVHEPQNWDTDTDFNGEGIPEMEDLFSKYILSNIGSDKSEIEYYEPYYMYNMSIIILKLYFFKYYYKKYFCPVHTDVLTASVERKEIISDIKITQKSGTSICDGALLCQDECIVDIFNCSSYDISDIKKTVLYFEGTQHYIDRDFIEFSIYNKKEYYNNIYDTSSTDNIDKTDDINIKKQIYEVHEACVVIPVRFWSSITEKNNYASTGNINTSYIYKTEIIISKYRKNTDKYEEVYLCSKSFVQQTDNIFENIILIPKLITKFKNEGIQWWTEGEYRIDICCNGRWFSQVFTIELPELTVETGYLEYKYDQMFSPAIYNVLNDEVIYNDKAGTIMWEPSLVGITNSNYISDISKWKELNTKTNDNNYCQLASLYKKDNLVNKYKDIFNIPSVDIAPEYYNLVFYIDWKFYNEGDKEMITKFYLENEEMRKQMIKTDTTYFNFMFMLFYIGYMANNKSFIYNNYYVYNYVYTGQLNFDNYFMIDEEYYNKYNEKKYYEVYISRFTIGYLIDILKKYFNVSLTPNEVIKKTKEFLSKRSGFQEYHTMVGNFIDLKYGLYDCILPSLYCADTLEARFLPNRMCIVKTENSNTIPSNKILCCSLYTNNKAPIGDSNKKLSEYSDKTETSMTTYKIKINGYNEEGEPIIDFYEQESKLLGLSDSFNYDTFNLPFKLDVMSSKWKFIPYSINIKDTKTVVSNGNIAIMSTQDTKSIYMSGYYNVEVEYSLDGKTTQIYKLPYKINIK